MNQIKARITIMSHLSDIQELMGIMNLGESNEVIRIQNEINFVKYLLLQLDNINDYIDVEKHWQDFVKSRFFIPITNSLLKS
jgi:hypothetical protein